MWREPWLGWHFLADDGRIATLLGDHQLPQPLAGTSVHEGQTLRVPGEPLAGSYGLHAAKHAAAALFHAPGQVVCRVRLSGVISAGRYYAAAQERTVIQMAPAGHVIAAWAVAEAQRQLDAEAEAGRPLPRELAATLAVKRRYLDGQASEADVRAARNDCRRAAKYAVWLAGRIAGYPTSYTDAAHQTYRAVQCDLRVMAARRQAYIGTPAWLAENQRLELWLMSLLTSVEARTRRERGYAHV